MDRNTRDVSGDSEAMLSFFGCSKFSVWVCNTSNIHTGQTFTINWSKIQLSWVLMLSYPYKMMFSGKKSVIVTPYACSLFVSKVTKINGSWMSIFGGHFSALFQWVMTESWNQLQSGCWNYLYYIFIHSCKYTTFQIKTVFNNVLFSTEVHNPLHAHLLALSHIRMSLPCGHMLKANDPDV